MQLLSEAELLEVWELGADRHIAYGALLLLAYSDPDKSIETLARMSIGQRDHLLLNLREHAFGRTLEGLIDCPNCDEHLEISFSTSDIHSNANLESNEALSIESHEYKANFSLPNSIDILSINNYNGLLKVEGYLLQRCFQSAFKDGAIISISDLPSEVLNKAVESMADADTQSDIQISVTCSACGHQWEAIFDIAYFLWKEIEYWAKKTLMEVHLIASAYGWDESEILALSPTRRQIYLEMIGG